MSAAKRRFVLISALWTIGIALSGGAINVALTKMKAAPAVGKPRVPSTAVTTLVAQPQTYQERLVGYGKARPLTITEVSAGVPGDVTWRSPKLERGTLVNSDEELVRIDDRDLKTAVATATARLAQAKQTARQHEISLEKLTSLEKIAAVELQTSERSHKRLKELMGSAISDEEFDASLLQLAQSQRALLELQRQAELASPELERAQAEVLAAEASLEQANINLLRAVVRAPYSGYIEDRMVQLGARVAQGTQLFRIVDTSRIEVPIALPASEYAVVKPGSAAVVRLAEGGPVVWKGKVDRVSPMIDDVDRTFFAFLSVAGSEDRPAVPAGAFVVAEIDGTSHEDVIVVPRTAVVGDRVYVAGDGDGTEGTSIIEGRTPGIHKVLTDVVLLDSGVKTGERIVVTNVEKIGDGSRVSVIKRVEDDGAE